MDTMMNIHEFLSTKWDNPNLLPGELERLEELEDIYFHAQTALKISADWEFELDNL